MSDTIVTIDQISFSYPDCVNPLFESVSLQINQGWTAIAGANGSGKTTFLKLVSGLLNPDSGHISRPGKSIYTEQRTDFEPEFLQDFFNSRSKGDIKIKILLEIEDDWKSNWHNLSHGERKRCQIADALSKDPFLLAIDEPTNHLDRKSRKVLIEALKRYLGIGLIVSHDRELIDDLCQHTIFLDPSGIDLRRGGYSQATLEREREDENAMAEYELATRDVKKLKRRVIQQREKESRTAKKRSKRNLDPKDHDAKAKKDLGRLTGKDAVEGRIYRRFENKLEKARSYQKSIQYRKGKKSGIEFHSGEQRSSDSFLIPSGILHLNEKKILEIPELTLEQGEKVGLVGNNGTGKSSFLNYLISITRIPPEKYIYIPQEITAEESTSLIKRIKDYDRDIKGRLMIVISRLGSDPHRLLESSLPSPGEMRKLFLAEGILKNPELIIMDEPTNHMDLPSIECVEEALSDVPCNQLLVSHDLYFLDKLVSQFWRFFEFKKNTFRIERKYSS